MVREKKYFCNSSCHLMKRDYGKVYRSTRECIGRSGERTVERLRNRGDGFCLVHEKPAAAVEGGTADSGSIALFKERCEEFGFTPKQILPHDSYLINLGNPDADALAKSRRLSSTMQRYEQLGAGSVEFSPRQYVEEDQRRGMSGADRGVD